MKRNLTIYTILVLLTLSTLPALFLPNAAAQGTLEPTLSYSSGITTKSYSLYKQYDNETWFYNHSGTNSYSYSYEYDAYDGGDGYYYVEEKHVNSDIYYESWSNRTISGYFEFEVEMDMYEVEITYGDALKVNALALRNATMFMEYCQDYEYYEHFYNQTADVTEQMILKKYTDETRETLVDQTVISEIEYPNDWDDENSWENTEMMLMNQTAEFAAPIMLIYQIVTTATGQRFAWSELMWEYMIYNDTNEDGFYTCNNNFYTGAYGSEMISPLVPYFVNASIENIGPGTPPITEMSYPNNTKIEDAYPLIEFIEPTEEGGKVSWGYNYSSFPSFMFAYPYYPTKMPMGSLPYNMSYEDSPKADYTYEFDYSIDAKNGQSQLDFTNGLSVVETKNDGLYNAMSEHEFELTLPHFTYMLSSEKIEQEFPSVMSLAQDSFVFESNGETVAEIDMGNEKKPYTLYNHSDNEAPSTYDSVGASVSKLITSSMESAITMGGQNAGNPFCNLVFSIEDEVKGDPLIGEGKAPSKLFTIETQNYPKWSGNAIYHDPSFKVYLGDATTGDDSPPDGTGEGTIGIPNILGLVSILSVGALLSIYAMKKKAIIHK